MIRFLTTFCLCCGLLFFTLWVAVFFSYTLPVPPLVRAVLIAAWGGFSWGVVRTFLYQRHGKVRAHLPPQKHLYGAYGAVILGAIIAFFMMQPALDRDWADDVAYTVTGEHDGDTITLHHVRNFRWHTPDDYIPQWETRSYKLSQLERVDVFLSTWTAFPIAHTLVSFGFANGDYVSFSLEIRKERGEAFSSVAGFFRQFELAMIAADERDIIYTRTNARKEDVVRYQVFLTPKQRQELFLSFVDRGNAMAKKAEFYNTITSNCTTAVFQMVKAIVPDLTFDYRVLLSGFLPDYIAAYGGLDTSKSVATLTEEGALTPRAQHLTDTDLEHFSTFIRTP